MSSLDRVKSAFSKARPTLFGAAIVLAVATLLVAVVVTATHHDSKPVASSHPVPTVTTPVSKQQPPPPSHPAPKVTTTTATPVKHHRHHHRRHVSAPAPWKYHATFLTVKSGDSLTSLAVQASKLPLANASRESWQALFVANAKVIGPDPNLIVAGAKLRVPLDPAKWAARFVAPAPPPTPAPVQRSTPVRHHHHHWQPQAQNGPEASAGNVGTTGFLSGSVGGTTWQCIEMAESSDNPNDPDGLYGILQSTWESLGYSGTPGTSSIAEQNQAALRLAAADGSGPWDDPCTGT